MRSKNSVTAKLTGFFLLVALVAPLMPVFASGDIQTMQVLPTDSASIKFISAALAFCVAAISAGWAVSKAGVAGLAGAAERPEIRTTAVIISALGEAIAIYGIVIAIMILGQAT